MKKIFLFLVLFFAILFCVIAGRKSETKEPMLTAFSASPPGGTVNAVPYYIASNIFAPIPIGASGTILQSNGSGSAPGFVSFGSLGWSITGNSGTTPGTNFLGTTDSKGLMFKTNGSQSGYIDIANFNTSLGQASMISNSTGTFNSAFGFQALNGNIGGSFNTAIGTNSLAGNVNGTGNVAVGYLSGFTETGSDNTFIGDSAGAESTTAAGATFLGRSAGERNSSGMHNTYIGTRSGHFSASASGNTADGYFSLFHNIANFNNAFGDSSLVLNTTGGNNSAFGYSSLSSNTTASGVVAVGDYSGLGSTGSFNTFVGDSAGYGVGSNKSNTFLGYHANALGASPGTTNSTAIGNGASIVSSNTMQFGNTSVTSFIFGAGQLPIADGGTNNNSFTSPDVAYYNGTGVVSTPYLIINTTPGNVEAVNFVKFDSALGLPIFTSSYTPKHAGSQWLSEVNGDTTICTYNGKTVDSVTLGASITYTPSWGGFTATVPSGGFNTYRLNHKSCQLSIEPSTAGTSNATSCTVTAPFKAKKTTTLGYVIWVQNSGLGAFGLAQTTAGSATITLCPTAVGNPTGWTNSGNKAATLEITYEIQQ